MDRYRLVPMRRCPDCNAMIFLNPDTDETVYTCVCLEHPAPLVKDVFESTYEKRPA